MVLTSKTRLGKRKQEIQELRKDKQTTTSKKHDKSCLLEKGGCEEASKSQLVILQEKYDKLTIEFDKQVEKNNYLEEKVKKLEEDKNNYQPNVVKTDTGGILMLCSECEYPAEDIFDLGEHMFEFHSEKEEEEWSCSFCGESFISQERLQKHEVKMHKEVWPCNFCTKSFEWKSDMMVHKKEKHSDKISNCWNYILGMCDFGDQNCWFNHKLDSPAPQIICKVCNETFYIKSEYLQHMKRTHTSKVKFCRNINTNEGCKYGDNCWYSHQQAINDNSETIDNTGETNKEMIKKIIETMEKITERISELEQKE